MNRYLLIRCRRWSTSVTSNRHHAQHRQVQFGPQFAGGVEYRAQLAGHESREQAGSQGCNQGQGHQQDAVG